MKEEIVSRWLKKAEEDLKVAKYLLERKDLFAGAICFHCQQATEKYLKAYLTNLNIRVKKTHDMATIIDLCIEQDEEFESLDREKISRLSFYAVEVRYPDDFYVPTIEEATQSFEIALNVKDFIFQKLEIK